MERLTFTTTCPASLIEGDFSKTRVELQMSAGGDAFYTRDWGPNSQIRILPACLASQRPNLRPVGIGVPFPANIPPWDSLTSVEDGRHRSGSS